MRNNWGEQTSFGPAFDAEYEALPAALKMIYTPKQWAWLGAEERGRAVDRECMPDVGED